MLKNRRMLVFLGIAGVALFLLAACTGPSLAGISSTPSQATAEETGQAGSAKPSPETPEQGAGHEQASEAKSGEATTPVQPQSTAQPTAAALSGDTRPQRLRVATAGWHTDWTIHSVPYEEIISGGPPRDGIPSIDAPKFITQDEAAEWLAGNEPVIALEINGDARAYPLQILIWHEIVNDTVGGVPVAVTFCPLCNAAITFDRRLNGQVFEFGTSGLLRNSDLVMYDRTTESLWQQFLGEGIVGEMTGARLAFLPSAIVSFDDFRQAYPDGVVLSRETGFRRPYGRNPYTGYDTIGSTPFLFNGIVDGRLPAMERVVAVSFEDGTDVAYPFSVLAKEGAVNDSVNGHDLVVFYTRGTVSALGAEIIAQAQDVGATGVFDPYLGGQKLTFKKDGERIVDEQTGSTWNILGQAVEGPLAGKQLTPIIHGDHFWFSWAAFKPDTIVYMGEETAS